MVLMNQNPSQNQSNRSCPCKRVALSLSSFTAAEFGDVNSLSRPRQHGQPRLSILTDSAGNTPLHLAAQHGHVAATAYLLRSEMCSVNAGAATPLHRASYSGACATIRLLVEVPGCNLLARDTSFGDEMTPLHKAASGGRFLAVELLLRVLEEKDLLDQALQLRDARGLTPLQVAKERQRNVQQESESVARWNTVAGGPPNWLTCIRLLEVPSKALRSLTPMSQLPDSLLPAHLSLVGASNNCLDCEDGNGNCRTKSWENAFLNALSQSVHTVSRSSTLENCPISSVASVPEGSDVLIKEERLGTQTARSPEASNHTVLGRPCDECHKPCMAVFPKNGSLVCRNCNRADLLRRRIA